MGFIPLSENLATFKKGNCLSSIALFKPILKGCVIVLSQIIKLKYEN